jgi:signal transduction histidine kinase
MDGELGEIDRQIARARGAVSLLAIASLYVDPSAGGLFHLPGLLLATLGCHLAYSAIAYAGIPGRNLTIALDLTFASAIAFLTEGATSPSFVFFVFAIVASVFRGRTRDTWLVTVYSVSLYGFVIAFSHGLVSAYMMRAVYLAIAGYLIGFFGQQRAKVEKRLRDLEADAERLAIARSLHDGYMQALAATNLRLESCRDLLMTSSRSEALGEIDEVRTGLEREYDHVRSYVRFLANNSQEAGEGAGTMSDAEVRVKADFTARASIAEQILQILVEGLRNVRRHARARSSLIVVEGSANLIRIKIDDDGVGFGAAKIPPWTIASRIAEMKGRLTLVTEARTGAHLEMEIPSS